MKDDVNVVAEPGIGRPDGLKGIFGELLHHFVYKLKTGEFRRIIHLEPNVSTVEMQKSSTERDYAKNDPVVVHAACDSKGGMELVHWKSDEWRRANPQEKEAGAGSVVEIIKTTLPKFRFWNTQVTPAQRQNGYPGCVATMVASFKKQLAPKTQFTPFFAPTHKSETGIGVEDESEETEGEQEQGT